MDKYVQTKYLLSSEQDQAWGMIVTTTGDQLIPPHARYPVGDHPMRYSFSTENGRTLNEYQLVYISQGHGTFVSASHKPCSINEGSMFLLFPGEWHNYWPDPETGWHESWVGIAGLDMERRATAGFFRREEPVFKVGVHEHLRTLFKLAIRTAREQNAGYQQMLAGIANLLLGFAYSENHQSAFEESRTSNLVRDAKQIMQQNISTPLTAEQIAGMAGVGYSWFRRIFKEYTGFSPMKYMQEVRIGKSKELLTNTSLTCQEIAYETGFESPAYFNVAFRKLAGMTPVEYRRMTRIARINQIDNR